MEPASFGELLRRFRLAAGLTQELLATRAGLSLPAISTLERGTRLAPHRETVRLLCEALNLSADDRAALMAAAAQPRSPAPISGVPVDRPVALPATQGLPITLTSLVGRERDLTAVGLLIAEGRRLVTLTGPGGVGKTRLAIEVASNIAHNFATVWFAELAPLDDPRLVPQLVGTLLGVHAAPADSYTTGIVTALGERTALLVLDNCEHLLDACASLVVALLRDCPGAVVLATSREPLHIRGEQLYPVPPLSLAPEAANGSMELPPDEQGEQAAAVQLFMDRARAVRPDFALNRENAHAVHEICRRLDGLPLGIEIVAAQVRLLHPEQIAARLSRLLQATAGNVRDLDPRHRTLRALIDWSYDRLSASEQALLRRLSVFAGGCDLAAVEAVCADPQQTSDAPLDLLFALVDKSLVVAEAGVTDTRYRLLESVREYCHERLAVGGEESQTRLAHVEYFVRRAELADAHEPAWEAVARELETDVANVRAALSYSREAGDRGELLLRFAAALGYFWHVHGYADEGTDWCKAALAQPAATEQALLRARVQFSLGQLAWDLGDLRQARALLTASAAALREEGDSRWLARALYILGEVVWQCGEVELARRLTEESAACAQAAGAAWELGIAQHFLGTQAARHGNLALARGRYKASLTQIRRVGDDSQAAYVLRNLGYLGIEEKRFAAAERWIAESLALNRGIDDRRGVAACLAAYAALAIAQQQPALAARLCGVAAAVLQRAGASALHPTDRPIFERTIATGRAALGEHEFASRYAEGRSVSIDAALGELAAGMNAAWCGSN